MVWGTGKRALPLSGMTRRSRGEEAKSSDDETDVEVERLIQNGSSSSRSTTPAKISSQDANHQLWLAFLAGVLVGMLLLSSLFHWNLLETEGFWDSKRGWKTLEVFYGDRKLLPVRLLPHDSQQLAQLPADLQRTPWSGQSLQDAIVCTLLKQRRKGYFIDLAAHDATLFSNTYALEKNFDWRGLCIEANPEYWQGLVFRNCHVVGAVVGKKRMEQVTFRFASGLGGIVKDDFDNLKNGTIQSQPQPQEGEELPKLETEEVSRYTVPLLEVLRRVRAPSVIDYLSLDVEGAEGYILSTFPLAKYKIKLLTIERPKQSIQNQLLRFGYICLQEIASHGETIWSHKSYVPSMNLTILNISARQVLKTPKHHRCGTW